VSKKTDKLLPEDFGKSFDMEVFHKWKQSVNEHEQASIIMMILYFTGFIALLLLGSLVGVALFFILAFIGLGITLPKQSKRKRYQRQLGINNKDVINALNAAKNRTN
jgi:Flp pilus assembly protein TadB